ncbi:CsgG/HfaB family protein [Robertkochia sediminum]|uniref:CsgG/HfaB family protein n=1 Tax=Robertkochia sediminum TaxID=2785326 RepID=UPI001931403B|nr:CsgG/HfaB family protein [Robertkochia sediminum]MBL7471282.1 outer membrane beta-barrel protein [Robertkochia sediminum]
MRIALKRITATAAVLLLSSCGTYFSQPLSQQQARTGEVTSHTSALANLPLPKEPVVVGVYNFKDQTGQYKAVENGSTFSTAVSQGGTTMLVKALEDSRWFTPIERENLSNLLNERNIIRSTRSEYSGQPQNKPNLPPLLFAGILLEGGVVSYDTNIVTGGLGARYFGVGGSTQYREDRLTIYLRAVSTSNGKILKTVYVSKTILSQAIDASLFRYVNFQRLLEVETGITKNEPVQLAMKDAIEKAVESLIIEGIESGLWSTADGRDKDAWLVENYNKEKAAEQSTLLYDREQFDTTYKNSFSFGGGVTLFDGDYTKKRPGFNGSFGYHRKLSKMLGLGLQADYNQLEGGESWRRTFLDYDLNLELMFLPKDKVSPFIYGGPGLIYELEDIADDDLRSALYAKVQFGGGLNVRLSNRWDLALYAENNFSFTDALEGVVNGKRDDFYYNFGLRLHYKFGLR